MAAIGTILVDEGNGTTTECHRTWKGSEGPFLTPVGEQFEVKSDDDAADGSGVSYDSLPLRTTNQLSIEAAPSDDYHVMRRVDYTDGSLSELVIGDLRIRSTLGSGIGYIDLRVSGSWVNKMQIDNT